MQNKKGVFVETNEAIQDLKKNVKINPKMQKYNNLKLTYRSRQIQAVYYAVTLYLDQLFAYNVLIY